MGQGRDLGEEVGEGYWRGLGDQIHVTAPTKDQACGKVGQSLLWLEWLWTVV